MNIPILQSIVSDRGADALFVSSPINIYYLTGFRGLSPEEREVGLLVTRDRAIVFVPAMYEAQAKQLESMKNGDVTLAVVDERDDLMGAWIDYVRTDGVVLFEDSNLVVNEFWDLQNRYAGSLQPLGSLIQELRVVKQPEEVETIRTAVELTDQVFERTLDLLRSNDYTEFAEFEIADFIRTQARKLGGDGLSFDPIIASGAASALPHYFTGDKKLQRGDVLLMDLGVRYKGYCGDLTRCVALGKPDDNVKRMYGVVRACNERCIAACKPGVTGSELDEIARAFFKEHNVDQYFLHGLGHGIGLEVHEGVFLRQKRMRALEPGMVVTIEPGLYFEGAFGVRVEDYVLVTQTGCEELSKAPKELIEIP